MRDAEWLGHGPRKGCAPPEPPGTARGEWWSEGARLRVVSHGGAQGGETATQQEAGRREAKLDPCPADAASDRRPDDRDASILLKRRQDFAREALHRLHHACVLEVAEPEAAVEVRDAHHLLDALDLADHRVGRADDQEAVEQIVGVRLLRRRHGNRAALFDALVLVAE